MAGIFITGVGIFGIGVVVGIIFMVCKGIHRERRRYEERRRYRAEHGIWEGADTGGHFLPEEAPDGVSLMARSFNGLYVRHFPDARRPEPELAAQA